MRIHANFSWRPRRSSTSRGVTWILVVVAVAGAGFWLSQSVPEADRVAAEAPSDLQQMLAVSGALSAAFIPRHYENGVAWPRTAHGPKQSLQCSNEPASALDPFRTLAPHDHRIATLQRRGIGPSDIADAVPLFLAERVDSRPCRIRLWGRTASSFLPGQIGSGC
jgi:hypothetical protein